MAIKTKDVRNLRVAFPDNEYKDGAIHFEADDRRYHVWIYRPRQRDREWRLGETLYSNPIETSYRGMQTRKLDFNAATHAALRAWVIAETGFTPGAFAEMAAAHLKAKADAEAEAAAALYKRRADAMRAAAAEALAHYDGAAVAALFGADGLGDDEIHALLAALDKADRETN